MSDTKRLYRPADWGIQQTLSDTSEIRGLSENQGLVTVSSFNLPVDFYYDYVGSDTTVVSFHAALSAQTEALPVFTGRKVTEMLGVNRLFLSDPALIVDRELTLAWFLGTSDLDYPAVCERIIRELQQRFGGQHLIFFGASGGGFASLNVAHRFPGSLAVCVNPQTKITDYGEKFWTRYARLCFGANDEESARRIFDLREDSEVRRMYAQSMNNHVLYVQNAFDSHMRIHMLPFVKDVERPAQLGAVLGWTWGQGHKPPPATTVRNILRHAGRVWGDWDRLFELVDADVAPNKAYLLSALSRAKKEL